jgi:hypothetical protein
VLAVLAGSVLVVACGGRAPVATPAPAPATGTPDVAALALATREACTALIEREAAQVIAFATYNRPTETLWDVAVRIRKEGQLTRIGCRYDVSTTRAVLYDPASPPPLPASAVAASPTPTPAPTAPAASGAAATPVAAAPAKAATPPAVAPAKPAAVAPEKRLAQDLSWVPDTVARAAMARTRDGCLAEARRQKLEIDAIDSFQREAGSTTRWEVALMSVRRNRRTPWQCTFDLSTDRATLREVKPAR